MPDLETLQLLWWILIGFMFIAFALTDGFDFGVAVPVEGRDDIVGSTIWSVSLLLVAPDLGDAPG